MTADELRALIQRCGHNQTTLAQVSGLARGTINRMVQGRQPITANAEALIRNAVQREEGGR